MKITARALIEELQKVSGDTEVMFHMDDGCCGEVMALEPYQACCEIFSPGTSHEFHSCRVRLLAIEGFESCRDSEATKSFIRGQSEPAAPNDEQLGALEDTEAAKINENSLLNSEVAKVVDDAIEATFNRHKRLFERLAAYDRGTTEPDPCASDCPCGGSSGCEKGEQGSEESGAQLKERVEALEIQLKVRDKADAAERGEYGAEIGILKAALRRISLASGRLAIADCRKWAVEALMATEKKS
jgi:hypothetical protein